MYLRQVASLVAVLAGLGVTVLLLYSFVHYLRQSGNEIQRFIVLLISLIIGTITGVILYEVARKVLPGDFALCLGLVFGSLMHIAIYYAAFET
jgi:hypothetical protein